MNITKVAAWSEIVSSVAVLATLVYLAVQVEQNTAAIRADTHQEMIDADQHNLSLLVSHPTIWQDWETEGELTPDRKVRLHAYLVGLLRSREYQWFQYQNGVLDETTWQSWKGVIHLALGTKRNRIWWKQVGRMVFDPGFAEMVDEMVEGQPYVDYVNKVLAMD